MLLKINSGGTGLPRGCQQDIVHLVSSVATGVNSGNDWVIADGNAGARHTNFSNEIASLGELNWNAINARWWNTVHHHKQAEFLVADFLGGETY